MIQISPNLTPGVNPYVNPSVKRYESGFEVVPIERASPRLTMSLEFVRIEAPSATFLEIAGQRNICLKNSFQALVDDPAAPGCQPKFLDPYAHFDVEVNSNDIAISRKAEIH